MNTYRGFQYDQDDFGHWFFVNNDGLRTGAFETDEQCMDAIDKYRRENK